MLALIGYGLLGIVVAGGVVALLVLVLPADHLGAAPRDVVPAGLPSRPEIDGEDVARVRLPVTLRGYRMVDTDAVLDRLALELERRDSEIDALRRSAGLPVRASSAPSFVENVAERGRSAGADEVLAGPATTFAVDDSARPYAPADDSPSHPLAGDHPHGDHQLGDSPHGDHQLGDHQTGDHQHAGHQHEAAADGAGSPR